MIKTASELKSEGLDCTGEVADGQDYTETNLQSLVRGGIIKVLGSQTIILRSREKGNCIFLE